MVSGYHNYMDPWEQAKTDRHVMQTSIEAALAAMENLPAPAQEYFNAGTQDHVYRAIGHLRAFQAAVNGWERRQSG